MLSDMSVRRSLLWTYGAHLTSFLITFFSSVIVARLVSPRDFGIYAMAVAATTIMNVFMQLGLAKYIMREAELSRDLLRSLFTVNFFMTLLYCLAILVGSAVARFFANSEEVANFLLVFAIFPILAMMEFIPSALAAREMRFGLISALAILRVIVLAGSTIALALFGFAYMSFAWAQVITFGVTAIAFNIAIWRPDVWKLRFVGIRNIAKFGLEMIGIGGITQLNTRLGEMTMGSLLGLGTLGVYTRAAGLPATIYSNVFGAGSNVVFSRLSNDLREVGTFHETYLRFMRLLLGVLWPMMVGIAVLAEPIIATLYGHQWQAAAVPLSLLTIAAAITVAIGMTAEIHILRHRTKQQVRIETWRAIFGYTAFAAGATLSLTLAAVAKVAEALFAYFLYRRPMIEMVGGPPGALRRIYLEALLITSVAVLPAFVLMVWFGFSPATPLLLLAGTIFLGVICWALLLMRLRHPLYQECARLLRPSH
ncbi:oligosaccharide flippase family protein [Sphingomonas glaciei]|uniref:Oligosaccharide flippase family protein n=1 Tax=Sphingomonas glaciei TaxID=2938948 RepID=A0ABY5MSR7_9SPHN|nr:oligosaccharide flippase family protein [Sphingomonas glaciei]UUR06966.1 oligosaccharide flippase family protein [Sphingomonas glaciei]